MFTSNAEPKNNLVRPTGSTKDGLSSFLNLVTDEILTPTSDETFSIIVVGSVKGDELFGINNFPEGHIFPGMDREGSRIVREIASATITKEIKAWYAETFTRNFGSTRSESRARAQARVSQMLQNNSGGEKRSTIFHT